MNDKSEDAATTLDQAGPDASAVAAFINEAPAAGAVDKAATTQDEPAKQERVEFTPDDVFAEDPREEELNRLVTVDEQEIAITELEQDRYLKATLNGVNVILPIVMMRDVEIQVRSLSTYENDIVLHALKKLTLDTDMLPVMYQSMMQRYAMAMQVVSFNGLSIPYLEFKTGTTSEEAVEQLAAGAERIFGDMPSLKYGLCFRAVNAFNYKMAKLQSMAFNRDFWCPEGTA